MCGLKHHRSTSLGHRSGHTLRGCVDWNLEVLLLLVLHLVTPCVGVWIETLVYKRTTHTLRCHTLRGCVDWNRIFLPRCILLSVTPCVGVWIETCLAVSIHLCMQSHPAWVCGLKQTILMCLINWYCHTLRGCVDWNWIMLMFRIILNVTPCVGVWIETSQLRHIFFTQVSHPAWVCGLKLSDLPCLYTPVYVTPCVGVWIETGM